MNRSQNVVIFSAGKSDENGNLSKVVNFLEAAGHRCVTWRGLFVGAKRQSSIALLPMLLKKIPTFDYAIILGDGVDRMDLFRDELKQVRIIRDNVLFEMGLCLMGLGATRVMLLIEDDVRIPEDLDGVSVPGYPEEDKVERRLGMAYFEYRNPEGDSVEGNLEEKMELVLAHMEKHAAELYPVVVGAAISTADGYFNNFVLRLLENLREGFKDLGETDGALRLVDEDRVTIRILIPREIYRGLGREIWKYYEKEGYRRAVLPTGEFRGVEFRYREEEDGHLTVCDIPSTVTASYDTVVDILQLDADDEFDQLAEERFLSKELDSFVKTLRKLMVPEKVEAKERHFIREAADKEERIRKIVDGVKRIEIGEVDLRELREV